MEAGGGAVTLQAGNEDKDVARFRSPQAECAAGPAAIVAIGWDTGRQVGVEMNRAVEPRCRSVAARVGQVAHPEHRGVPFVGFGNGK